MGAVKGAVVTAISGISVNNDNYDMVVTLLQEKFGRKEAIIESSYKFIKILCSRNPTYL